MKVRCIECRAAPAKVSWQAPLNSVQFCGDACNQAFVRELERETLKNTERGPVVVYNDPSGRLQVAYMAIPPGQDVPMERHEDLSQFVRVEQGHGEVIIDGQTYEIHEGHGVVIPSGSWHRIINTSESDVLKMYTIYAKNQGDKWEH